jgi:fatty acid desaturase
MEAKQYADALSDRLSPEIFKPVPGRAWWLPVHASIVALCMFAMVDADPGLPTRFGLSILIAIAFTCLGILGHEILHGSVVERL